MAWPGPLTWLHAYPPAHRGHITGPVLQMGKLKLGVGGVQGLAAGVVKSSNLGAKRALDFGHPPGLTSLKELRPLAPQVLGAGQGLRPPLSFREKLGGLPAPRSWGIPCTPRLQGRGSPHFLFLPLPPQGSARLGPPAAPGGPGLPAPSSCLPSTPSSPQHQRSGEPRPVPTPTTGAECRPSPRWPQGLAHSPGRWPAWARPHLAMDRSECTERGFQGAVGRPRQWEGRSALTVAQRPLCPWVPPCALPGAGAGRSSGHVPRGGEGK